MAMMLSLSYSSALLSLLLVLGLASTATGACCRRLFSFGDSIIDTGNLAISSVATPAPSSVPPYGETFFHRPTGRFCDGRLIVDFITEALKMPFSIPYLGGKTAEDFQYGANFAVGGGTALRRAFFRKLGLDLTLIPPYSLDVQMEWFHKVLHLLGSTDQEREKIMSSSLFLMGEIGGNDYNHPFFQNRSFTQEIKPLVPKVIKKIGKAINVLIDLGAKTIVVPGNFLLGCVPRYLTMFQSKNPNDYDATGCLKWLNDFSEYHNRALKRKLEQIRHVHQDVTLVYGDYYAAFSELTTSPLKHGFNKNTSLMGCCGDGGPYNSNSLFACTAKSKLCPDPSKYISWDGLHLTEASYQIIAQGLLQGPYVMPPILSICEC